MTNRSKWGSPSLLTVLSAELNAAIVNNATVSLIAVDNTANEFVYCDIEVVIPFASGTPSSSAMVIIYFIEAVDGTDFDTPFFDTNNNNVAALMPIGQATATPQRVVARQVPLPPAMFKVSLGNWTGLTLPATGNTVKLLMYGYNLNG